MSDANDDMAPEYDFRNGSRGKFFREGAAFLPPIHLDPDLFDVLQKRAAAEGLSVSDLANQLLRQKLKNADPVG